MITVTADHSATEYPFLGIASFLQTWRFNDLHIIEEHKLSSSHSFMPVSMNKPMNI